MPTRTETPDGRAAAHLDPGRAVENSRDVCRERIGRISTRKQLTTAARRKAPLACGSVTPVDPPAGIRQGPAIGRTERSTLLYSTKESPRRFATASNLSRPKKSLPSPTMSCGDLRRSLLRRNAGSPWRNPERRGPARREPLASIRSLGTQRLSCLLPKGFSLLCDRMSVSADKLSSQPARNRVRASRTIAPMREQAAPGMTCHEQGTRYPCPGHQNCTSKKREILSGTPATEGRGRRKRFSRRVDARNRACSTRGRGNQPPYAFSRFSSHWTQRRANGSTSRRFLGISPPQSSQRP